MIHIYIYVATQIVCYSLPSICESYNTWVLSLEALVTRKVIERLWIYIYICLRMWYRWLIEYRQGCWASKLLTLIDRRTAETLCNERWTHRKYSPTMMSPPTSISLWSSKKRCLAREGQIVQYNKLANRHTYQHFRWPQILVCWSRPGKFLTLMRFLVHRRYWTCFSYIPIFFSCEIFGKGTPWVECWAAAKDRYLVRFGPKTNTFYNQVKIAPCEPCHLSKAHCTCFGTDKAHVHPILSTLLDSQLFFFVVFTQSEALHSSTLCPPYECGRSGRPPPPPTTHTTPYEQHTHLPTHLRRETDTTYGYQFAPWPQTAVRQLHPKSS